MSDIFGGIGASGSGDGPSSYDLSQNQAFNDAITAVNNTIAGSTVNLAPITARLDALESGQLAQDVVTATKLPTTTFNTFSSNLDTYKTGVDDTLTQFFNQFGVVQSQQNVQDGRLTALESNVATGYVTHSEQAAYAASVQVKQDSQDAQIDDIYLRLGGTGQTVDLGPLTTRVTAIEAEQVTQNNAINTKATTAYVDFKSNLLQTNIDQKVPIDAYSNDYIGITNRLTAVESVNATQTSNINEKLNITSYNAGIISQGGVDLAQNNRLTAIEGTLGNFSTTANRINVTQPEGNLQSWLDADVVVTAGQAIDIGMLQAKVSILEDAVINNPPTVAISQVTGLQTNLTSLQTQITTDVNALATHKTVSAAHSATNISNTPIANLTQLGGNNVQTALTALGAKIDQVTVNSTGFTAYTNTLLGNWGSAANALAIPSNMFALNYITNDETSTSISGNRGTVLWGIDQNLARNSRVGFKTLRLGSKYSPDSTALGGSDASNTSWDFALANTITTGSLGANYYRQNPWRMEMLNPYSSAVETIWSIRGPQFSGDTTSKMIVDTNMVLTDVSNTVSKRFVDIMLEVNNNNIAITNHTNSINSLTSSLNSTNSTVTSHTSSINTLNSNVSTLQTQVANFNASNFVVTNSTANLTQLTCTTRVGCSSNGVITDGAYFDSQGRIQQRNRTILDFSGNVYGNRLLGGLSNSTEDSFRLYNYAGAVVFSANDAGFYARNGSLFFDDLRNILAAQITTTSLHAGGNEIIDGLGGIHLAFNMFDSSGGRIVLDTSGALDTPFISINNQFAPNGFGLSIEGSDPSYIKFDGSAKIGSVTIGNGIRARGDVVAEDTVTTSIIPIRRNCVIEGIPGLVDVQDTLLGFSNTAKGSINSVLGGQKCRTIVGYLNSTISPLSCIVGSLNVMPDSGTNNNVYVLGAGWSDVDLAHSFGLKTNSRYICLGNATGDNNVTGSGTYLMIAAGSKIPSGAYGTNISFVQATAGFDTVVPGANRPGSDIWCMVRAVSARKYKENIREIPNGSYNIDELVPVRYNLKESGIEQAGFIADDLVGTSWSEYVVYDDKKEVDSLAYNMMVVGLTDALKTQKRLLAKADQNQEQLLAKADRQQLLIEALDEDNVTSQQKISSLELRITNLENIIRNYIKLE